MKRTAVHTTSQPLTRFYVLTGKEVKFQVNFLGEKNPKTPQQINFKKSENLN